MGGLFGSRNCAHHIGGIAQGDTAEPRLIPAGAHGSLDLTCPDGFGPFRLGQISFGQGREWGEDAPVYRLYETDDAINWLPQQSVALSDHKISPIKPTGFAPSNRPRDLAPKSPNF